MILIYMLAVNIIAFIMYGVDKNKAKHHKWRISENALILIAAIGGSIGAAAGMLFFHHKTKHVKFYVGVPLIIILQAAIVILYNRIV